MTLDYDAPILRLYVTFDPERVDPAWLHRVLGGICEEHDLPFICE